MMGMFRDASDVLALLEDDIRKGEFDVKADILFAIGCDKITFDALRHIEQHGGIVTPIENQPITLVALSGASITSRGGTLEREDVYIGFSGETLRLHRTLNLDECRLELMPGNQCSEKKQARYIPLNYWQMKQILEDNGMYLLQLYNPNKDCHDFTVMQGDAVIRADLGLMDVESFILHRNLKRAEHPKWSSEDRLERQAQAHLEAAAQHRDDPMF